VIGTFYLGEEHSGTRRGGKYSAGDDHGKMSEMLRAWFKCSQWKWLLCKQQNEYRTGQWVGVRGCHVHFSVSHLPSLEALIDPPWCLLPGGMCICRNTIHVHMQEYHSCAYAGIPFMCICRNTIHVLMQEYHSCVKPVNRSILLPTLSLCFLRQGFTT
jgi:hypothetical protein